MTSIHAQSNSTITGWRLLAARVAWFVIAILFIGAYLVSIGPSFERLRTPCEENCPTDLLTLSSEEVVVLEDIGLSLDSYAIYQLGLQVLVFVLQMMLVCLIFWRRSDELSGLVVSGVILMGATLGFAPTSDVLVLEYPDLDLFVN